MEPNDIVTIDTSVSQNKVSDNDLLYLILRYFHSFGNFQDVTTLLENRMHETSKFGKVIGWDGHSRNLNLTDFQRKFPLITSNHLPALLAQRVSKLDEGSFGNSLLRCITGFYNPTIPSQFDLFRNKSAEFSIICGRLREALRKREFLHIKLTILTSPQIQKRIEPSYFQQVLLSDGTVDLTAVTEYDEANPNWRKTHLTLHEADISRQIQKISNEIPALDNSILQDQTVKSETINELRELGCLLNGLYRGNLDCGIDFFNQRLLTSTRQCSNFYRSFSPSSVHLQHKLLSNYKRLYTISGHSYNPVYCSVFDLTGNFLITGADDYLVKIWDVNKGQLIRTCRGHKNYITLIAISSDNSMFASSCTAGSIRVWRMRDGLCLLVLHHNSQVNWLKFDSYTGCLASGSDDGYSIVWDLVKLVDATLSDSTLLETLRTRNDLRTRNLITIDCADPEIAAGANTSMYPCSSSSAAPPSISSVEPLENNEEQKTIIGLPHLQDCSLSSVQGDPRKVLSLDISPLGNIIATGCDDGVVRVWKYGSSSGSRSRNRDPNKEMKLDLARIKGQLSPSDFIKYERILNHLLLRLEGHVSPVTDIQINRGGDRILTASTLDGSVRIWSLNSDYSDSVHIILDLADEDDDNINRSAPIRIRGRGSTARQRSQIHVYNVTWTCDDLRVITIQSVPNLSNGNSADATRLKVWNSITGELIHVIKNISDTASRCICRHPTNPDIVVTAGEDGIVNIWNTEKEANLHNFKLSIESIENPGSFIAANVVDLSFSPDGSRLAATDFFGRLTMFGLDDPKRFENVLLDQYFSSDYAEIMHDHEGNALDVGTQLPVHISPVGFLCKIDGAAYGYNPKIFSRLEPLPLQEIEEQLKLIEEENKTVWKERDRMFRLFQRQKERGVSSSFKNRRKSRESPKFNLASKSNIKPFQPLRPPRKINYIDFDVNQYQPSSEDSADSEWDGNSVEEKVDEDISFGSISGSGEDAIATRAALRKKRRGKRSRGSGLRRSSRHRTHVESYDDAIGNNADSDSSLSARFPTSRSARLATRRRKRYGSGNEELSDDSNESFHSKESIQPNYWFGDNVSEEPKRKKGRPKNNEAKAKPTEKPRKSQNATKLKRAKRATGGASLLDYGLEIDRSWLQYDVQQDHIYVPQIGDRVIYFPQGHREHLQRFTEDVSPPWNSFPQKWPLVECVVRQIVYRFPKDQEYRWSTSVVAEVTLAIVGTPSRNIITSSGQYIVQFVPPRLTRHNTREELIKVTVRNSQLPDFLVLSDLFMKTIRVAWHQGILISVQYKESNENGEVFFKEYQGKVVALSNCDPDWPHSPWEALEVSWEDNSEAVDRISPWEATAVHSSQLNSSNYTMNTRIEPSETQRILNEIQQLIEVHQAIYEPFQFEVDSNIYPEYYCATALPIYVELIIRRLQNQYYRQVESLIFDIDLLHENCRNFNSELSEIVAVATDLREKLLKIIYPETPVEVSLSDEQVGTKQHLTQSNGIRVKNRRSASSNDSLLLTIGTKSDALNENISSDANTGKEQQQSNLMITLKRKRVSSHLSDDGDREEDDDGMSNASSTAPRKKVSRFLKRVPNDTKISSTKKLNGTAEEANYIADQHMLLRVKKTREISKSQNGKSLKKSKFSSESSEEHFSKSGSEEKESSSENSEEYQSDDDEEQSDILDSRPSTRRYTRSSNVSPIKLASSKRIGNSKSMKTKNVTSVQVQPKTKANAGGRITRSASNKRVSSDDDENDDEEEEYVSDDLDDSSDNKGGKQDRKSQRKAAVTNESKSRYPLRRSSRTQARDSESDIDPDSDEKDNQKTENSGVRRSQRSAVISKATSSRYPLRRPTRGKTDQSDSENQEQSEEEEDENPKLRRSSRTRRQMKSYNEDESVEESSESDKPIKARQTRGSNIANLPVEEKRTKKNLSHQIPNSNLNGKRMDPEVKKTFQMIVSYAELLDEEYKFFAEPVDASLAPGYYDIIQNPMDLSTVRSKLLSRVYSEYREMIDDIFLIYDNCILYNQDDSVFTQEAKRQRKKLSAYISAELKVDW